MNDAKHELVEKLKGANNILVTVSANPSVDQLAACIGLTLLLNKLKKHATAVFSGQVPSTLEFLKPQETLEKNTDSLRDFIISLDKSKADKLRYKVEENVVKIFITPYKTSINQDDLDFSQGDFNVDVVLCLGINLQQDLDQAITAHGRILHDATVASINTHEGGELGTINWTNAGTSSLSELAVELADDLGQDLVDAQIATAFLTGIVAETARFSNEKTSPNTMKYSAELMSAGANQQLVSSALQSPVTGASTAPSGPEASKSSSDGTLEIGHSDAAPEPAAEQPSSDNKLVSHDVSAPKKSNATTTGATSEPDHQPASRMMLQPPSMGGQLTANSAPEGFDPSVDPLSMLSNDKPMLSHLQEGSAVAPSSEPELPKLDASALDGPKVIDTNPQAITQETVVSPEPTLTLPEVPTVPLEPETPTEPVTPVSEPSKLEPIFEPLPSEPLELPTSQGSAADDGQIQIDPQGNLIMPNQPPTPPAKPAEKEFPRIEKARSAPLPDVAAARDQLDALYSNDPLAPLQPKADVGASGYLRVQDLPGMEGEQPSGSPPPPPNFSAEPAPRADSPSDQPPTMPQPPSLTLPPADPTPPTSTKTEPGAPPPVPPPFNPLP